MSDDFDSGTDDTETEADSGYGDTTTFGSISGSNQISTGSGSSVQYNTTIGGDGPEPDPTPPPDGSRTSRQTTPTGGPDITGGNHQIATGTGHHTQTATTVAPDGTRTTRTNTSGGGPRTETTASPGTARRSPGSASAASSPHRAASAASRTGQAAKGAHSVSTPRRGGSGAGSSTRSRSRKARGPLSQIVSALRAVFTPPTVTGSGAGSRPGGAVGGSPAVTVGGGLGSAWWQCGRCAAGEAGHRDPDSATGRAATHWTQTHPGAPLRIEQR